jgi:predicted NodU family carbamoyl transferase
MGTKKSKFKQLKYAFKVNDTTVFKLAYRKTWYDPYKTAVDATLHKDGITRVSAVKNTDNEFGIEMFNKWAKFNGHDFVDKTSYELFLSDIERLCKEYKFVCLEGKDAESGDWDWDDILNNL